MMKGNTTVVPGVLNRVLVTSQRFIPRKIVIKVVRKIQERV